jgi:hypothetical protein
MLLFVAHSCSKILLKFNTKLHECVAFQYRFLVANRNALHGKVLIFVGFASHDEDSQSLFQNSCIANRYKRP